MNSGNPSLLAHSFAAGQIGLGGESEVWSDGHPRAQESDNRLWYVTLFYHTSVSKDKQYLRALIGGAF
jgi:hypothetical protein